MKKRFTRMFAILAGLSILFTVSACFVAAPTAHAALFNNGSGSAADQACQGVTLGTGNCDATAAKTGVNTVLETALNLISIVVGVLAVIMLIISGLRMVLSQGDSGTISSARSSILWSLVGLVIVILAQVIVRFVLARVSTP